VSTGFGSGMRCSSALCMTTAPLRRQLWLCVHLNDFSTKFFHPSLCVVFLANLFAVSAISVHIACTYRMRKTIRDSSSTEEQMLVIQTVVSLKTKHCKLLREKQFLGNVNFLTKPQFLRRDVALPLNPKQVSKQSSAKTDRLLLFS